MQSGRLFELLYLLLERGGMTVRELARRLEVSERTVRRDMEALSGAGVPIYAERGRNGGVRLLPGFVLNRTLLTQTEQDQILTALQTLQATGAGDERLLTHLQAVFRRSGWEWLDADFSDWSSSGRQRERFALIRQAIVQRRLISFHRHCRQDGTFTWDCGMEEMIDFCLRSAPELYQDRERSRALMRGYFPTLRRWQAAGR